MQFYKNKREVINYLKKRKFENKNILIKGSRKIQLEELIKYF